MFFRVVASLALAVALVASTVPARADSATTGTAAAAAPAAAVRDGVFIHVLSGPDEPHRLLMALRMAEIMSADKDVMMYFDIEGVKALTKSAPDVKHEGFDSSRAVLTRLLGKGIRIQACPACLKAAGLEAADLADGVTLAERKDFTGFTKGRILSLTY
jgi:predicted peroxiredoxin